MRILTRQQFMEMPKGTVFSYYTPCAFTGLYVKDSGPEEFDGADFCASDLVGAIACDSSEDYSDKCTTMENGGAVPVDFNDSAREGLFDDRQLYGVYDDEDVSALIDRLINMEETPNARH